MFQGKTLELQLTEQGFLFLQIKIKCFFVIKTLQGTLRPAPDTSLASLVLRYPDPAAAAVELLAGGHAPALPGLLQPPGRAGGAGGGEAAHSGLVRGLTRLVIYIDRSMAEKTFGNKMLTLASKYKFY